MEFDPTPFIGSAPCADCQLDVPGTWLARRKTGSPHMTAAEVAERGRLVRQYHKQGLLDAEIADKLGITRQSAWQWRTKLGLPVVQRPDKYHWADREAHAAHARSIGVLNVNSVRGKKISDQQWNSYNNKGDFNG